MDIVHLSITGFLENVLLSEEHQMFKILLQLHKKVLSQNSPTL